MAALLSVVVCGLSARAASPTISGTDAGQANTDLSSTQCFSGVTISSTNATVNLTIFLDVAGKGTFTNLDGFGHVGTNYTLTGATPANATTAIRGLYFVATPNLAPPGNSITTRMTIVATDSGASDSDNNTTVITDYVNESPTISGVDTETTDDKSTVEPFSSVTIHDDDSPPQNVTVTVLIDPNKGSFTTLNGFTTNTGGRYTFTGSDSAATTAIRGMVFTPTPNHVTPGDYETNRMTIVADDHLAPPVTNANTIVAVESINDTPTLSGYFLTRTIRDKDSTNLFANVLVGDVDIFGTQQVTVAILQDDSAKGVLLVGSSGFSSNSPVSFTFSGTPQQAQTAMRALVFDPTENRKPVGTNENTLFTFSVTDASGDSTNGTTTISSISINDPPTITGISSTHVLLGTGRTNTPYPGVVVSDPDVGDYTNQVSQHVLLKVTFAGASGNGLWVQPSLGFVAGSTYQFPDASISDATLAIQSLVYQAQTFPLSGTNIVNFTVSVADDHGLAVTNTQAAFDIYTPYTPPGLSGTRANQRVNDNATLALFNNVSIQSFNAGSFSVIIRLDSDIKGQLINLSGFTKNSATSPATYTFTGTSEAATVAIRQLLFQPVANRISGASTETTFFSITLLDGGVTNGPDTSTSVIVSPVNDAPTIQGISALAIIPDTSTRVPFPTVLISDVDETNAQRQTVTIRLDDNAKGAFTTNSLVLSGFTSNNAAYTKLGTPAAVTAAIRQLVFAPTPHRLPAGASENTTLSITTDDGQGAVVANNNTVIRVTASAGGPVFSLPSPQPVSLPFGLLINPFSSVSVADAQTLNLTLQATNPIWGAFTSNSLASNGFTNPSSGTYRISGAASNVTAALQALEFAPNTNLALGTVIVFSFSATNASGIASSATLAITLRLNQRSFIVTKTSDYNPNDGTVQDNDKKGTLRRAIQDAGANDHITFDIRSGSPTLPDYPATISLKTNLIINKHLLFDGPGADLLSISGDSDGNGTPDQQIFEINAHVVINRLTLTKGRHSFSGGAVEVNPDGALTLSYCSITESSADVWGGGVDVNGGAVYMDHCLVASNSTSTAFGEGGGGVSLYTLEPCTFLHCTFANNRQMAPSGLGGGGLYAENLDAGYEFDVLVLTCTFTGNSDAAHHGSSIRPNVFNTIVEVQNSLFADGEGRNLENDLSGDIYTLGGNISDDSTAVIFSIAGEPVYSSIFLPPNDRTNTIPSLAPLANYGGPTFTVALGVSNVAPSSATNLAVGNAISNQASSTYFSTLGTDQRGYFRDAKPDVGAYEKDASKRIIIEEILFANTNNQFIEFYVPRDSTVLNVSNFSVYIHGQRLHTFTNQNLSPGEALVLFARNAASTAVPTGVYSQIASNNILMDVNADTITLLNPAGQIVLQVSYVGSFVSSDPNDPGYLTTPNQSIMLSPQFQGAYLPYQRVIAKEGGRIPGTNELASPGYDATGNPLASGNAPPRAYDDITATDAQTPLPIIKVLANDRELDASDTIRVVGVGVTNGITPGVSSLTSTSHFGGTVVINGSGTNVAYDPRTSGFLTSLPQGSNVVDWFQYTILDSSNGVDNARGGNANEISNNIVKATATVTVHITGVNLAPTPQPDGTNSSPLLTTPENVVLDFTTANNVLANDTDPNTDDNGTTLTIISIQDTNAYVNSLQAVSALGAFVTLDIRFARYETHITYDPRGSAILDSLAQGQTATDTFYYSVMDRYGAIGTAAIHITVVGVNDTSRASADSVATDEDTPLNITAGTLLANDIDVDTGITNPIPPHLVISGLGGGSNQTIFSTLGAQVQIVAGNVVYNPTVSTNLNALARKEPVVDTFIYTATDDFGASSNAVVSVTVTGRNDTPITAPDFYSTGEKVLLSVSVPGSLSNDHDPDVNGVPPDDTLRVLPFTKLSTRGGTAVMNVNGSFTFDPRGVFDWLAQGQNTNDTFTYTVMDHSFSIANNDAFSVKVNSSSNVLSVLANDALLSQAGGALTIIAVSAPNKAGSVAIDATGHNLIYSPGANAAGAETFTYTISDGIGGTDTATVTATAITDILNGNLVANNDWFTVAKGTTVSFDVLANDNILPGSGAALSITAVGARSHGGSVSINGSGPNNNLTYSPNSANIFPLIETFNYAVSGGGSVVATGTVSVLVIDRANTLTANDDTFTVISGVANNALDVLANDLILPGPNTNLTITSIQSNGVTGTIWINAARTGLLYRPPPGVTNHQEPVVTYSIADGAGGSGSATVLIQVRSSGFFANEDTLSVTKNSQSNSIAVLLNDAILPNVGQTLTITDIGLTTNAPNQGGTVTINPTAKQLIYTPANGFFGDETFTYEISYGTVARAQGRVRVKVVDTTTLNSNPDAFSVTKNSANNSLPVLKNDYVMPKTLVSLTISRLQTNGVRGTVAINGASANNTLLYTPKIGFIGTDTFAYEISDGRGNTGTNQVSVTVGHLGPQPDYFSVLSDSSNNALDLLANDPLFPDTTTVRPLTGFGTPNHGGTVTTNGGGTLALYSPAPGFIGTETFTYQLQDDTGGIITGNAAVEVLRTGSDRSTNVITVTVLGTNDAPTITGTQSFAITDKQTVAPFPNVVIGELDAFGLQILTVTVSLDAAVKGTLTNLSGFTNSGPGVYTITGVASNITTSLHALVFVPTENRIPVNTSETTIFTITASDGYITVTNSSANVVVTSINDPPTISGTLANQRVYAHLTLLPFNGVTLADVDNLGTQPISVTVTLGDPAKGYFTNLSNFVPGGAGSYSLAATNPAAATTRLRALIYVPTPGNRLLPGASETNRITIAVNDGFAPTVTDSNTTIISTDAFIKKIASANGDFHDAFAYSVSANRDLVAVGVPNDLGVGAVKSGAAYLYGRNVGGSEAWGQVKKLVGSNSVASDLVGSAVGLSGDSVVVGAPNSVQGGIRSGVAYVFERNQGGPNQWGQSKKLFPGDGVAGDLYGASVVILGDTIVVGAYINRSGGLRTGTAYVYGRNQGGTGNWGLVKKIVPADGGDFDHFAISLSLSGDSLAVGSEFNSPLNNNNRAGSVYVFERNLGGTNNWGLVKKFGSTDGVSNDGLGHSVGISGDLIVAGAPFVTINNSRSGRVYLFARNQGGANQWGQVNSFLPFDNSPGSQFGTSVTVDGEIFAGGTFVDSAQGGAVYLYTRNYPGLNQWTPLEKIVPSTNDTYALFGVGLSLSQNTLAVGARFDDASNNRFAQTYIYRLKFNNSPYVTRPIPDQIATPGVPFTFTLPNRTFGDPDILDTLTLSLSFFPPPPSWLTFSPGTATFSGVPDNTPGTYPVVVRATDQDGASVTATFNIIIPGATTSTLSAKKVWRKGYFSPEVLANASLEATLWGDSADPDGDGVVNVAEYLFGSNPLSADPGDRSPLRITATGNPETVQISYRRRTDDWRITYTLQSSTYLTDWQPFDLGLVLNQSSIPMGDGTEFLTQEVLASASEGQFFNVRVLFIVPE